MVASNNWGVNGDELARRISEGSRFWRRHRDAWDRAENKALSDPEGFFHHLLVTRDGIAEDLAQRFSVEVYFDESLGRPAIREHRTLSTDEWREAAYLSQCRWRCYNTAICAGITAAEDARRRNECDAAAPAVRAAVAVMRNFPAFELALIFSGDPHLQARAVTSVSGYISNRYRLSVRDGSTRLGSALLLEGSSNITTTLCSALPGVVFSAVSEADGAIPLSELLEDLPNKVSEEVIHDLRSERDHSLKQPRRVVSLSVPSDGEHEVSSIRDADAATAEELLLHEEMRLVQHRALQAATQKLTPREREVLDLALQDVPWKDIASRLGLAASTVRVQYYTALKRLKVFLRQDLA